MRTCPCRVNRPKISVQKSLEDRCQFAKRGLFSQSTCSNRLTSVHMEASSGTVISTCFGGNKDFVAANTLRLQFSNLSLCKWPSLMLLFYFTIIECSMSICSMSWHVWQQWLPDIILPTLTSIECVWVVVCCVTGQLKKKADILSDQPNKIWTPFSTRIVQANKKTTLSGCFSTTTKQEQPRQSNNDNNWSK